MGYILPINHYQFSDERNRIIKSKRMAESVERPYKAVFEKHLEDQKGEYDRLTSNPTPVNFDFIDALSNKGKYINEKI
ncbi:hypothetical protein [Oceanobacillus bengalensis]|uniref:Uncharacterized protein n=1 Tax=Oceanobacillus bengalensis TaxID=1435466 RepID=A0A494YVK5_9BACI|nr:hypothetical protein [Oceanobacillus bengalensis]RKQ14131.1 hypothetical protein D8M05_13955 [Oceanobacillus bengalensis]